MILETFPVGPLHCNCTILGDEITHQAMVVDPGDNIPEILSRLQRHGLTLSQIVVTHAHIDHVGGAAQLRKATGAPVLMNHAQADGLEMARIAEPPVAATGAPGPSERPTAPAVLILTTFDLDEHVFAALRAGAAGFLVKDTSPADLTDAIKTVAAGESMLSPSVTTTLVAHLRGAGTHAAERGTDARLALLTAREHEVAVAIGRGLSNAEIAAELFMSVATVKAHVSRVFEKLGTTNRVQVAICVHDAGLV